MASKGRSIADVVRSDYLPVVELMSPNTRRMTLSHLGVGARTAPGPRQILGRFGDEPWLEVTEERIAEWERELQALGLSANTVAAKRTVLNAVLRLARGQEQPSPVSPPRRSSRHHKSILADADWLRVRAYLLGESAKLMCDTRRRHRLTFGELAGLRASDVGQHVLVIRGSVAWAPESPYGSTSWSLHQPAAGPRSVYLAVGIRRRLAVLVRASGLSPEDFIFSGPRMISENREVPAPPASGAWPTEMTFVAPGGKHGEHGRYTTYDIGCRCPACQGDAARYRRARQAPSVALDHTRPLRQEWFQRHVWKPACLAAGRGQAPFSHV